jgi:putative transposase
VHDRDAVHGRAFDARVRALGVIGVQTPRQAPNANAIAERLVRSIRAECLDRLIIINDRHLRAVLAEFTHYYNRERPHRSLALTSPIPGHPSRDGPVTSRAVLGGLHHVYARACVN